MKQALIIYRDKELALSIKEALCTTTKVEMESDLEIGAIKLKKTRYEYLFIETQLLKFLSKPSVQTYQNAINFLNNLYPSTPIIVFSNPNELRETVKAVKEGAHDYIIGPIKPEEVSLIISQIRQDDLKTAELNYFKDKFWSDSATELVVTKSKTMTDVYDKVKSVANTSSTVLLTGETGVGKSLIARLIHEHSNRKNGTFVSVHCGALPDNLVESELFGHEKGSFTGAIKRKLGRFEIANGGTIFLDEIGTISANTQIKLLQVIQDSVFQRVGGESDIKVDVRIIAATNENLKDLCDKKEFRNDLYYRLNVFPIEIPSLKDRKEDLSLLCKAILKKLNCSHSKSITEIDSNTLIALTEYSWPGNIRELENVLERAYIIESSKNIMPESLPREFITNTKSNALIPLNIGNTLAQVRNNAIVDIERQYLKDLLQANNGKIKETADVAGVGTRQLHKLMTKYGLEKEDFKLREL